MRVVVLVENTPNGDLKAEHGLSLFVEFKDKSYLIDTGKSNLFLENARKLDIDISDVDVGFLSHGHYDHSSGFEGFFSLNNHAKVYLQESCKTCMCYKIVDSNKKYIGIPKGLLDEHNKRFSYVNGFSKVDDGVYVVPHTMDLTSRAKRASMYSIIDGNVFLDDFSHEQTVVFDCDDGLVLFNSCSHGGVENIIHEVKEFFPNKEIKAFIGGFHLMGTDGVNSCEFLESEVKNLAIDLLNKTDATFFTGHCTGNIASKWLKSILKERFVEIYTGKEILFK